MKVTIMDSKISFYINDTGKAYLIEWKPTL